MLKDKMEKFTDELSQSFDETQKTLFYQSQKQFQRYVQDQNWMRKQYSARGKFKISLLQIVQQETESINQTYEKAFRTGLKTANQPIDKQAVKRLEEIKKQNAKMMISLANQVYKAHTRYISQINLQANQSMEVGELDRSNAIYNQIAKVMSSKDVQSEYKAVYSDGKKFSFKSYMEMNARTTLNQEIAQQQMESAVNNGDVFWLCNCFEDCRPSHIDYQGKVYYDERYLEMGFDEKTIKEIEQAIDSRGMVSRQSVENFEPYLGNTPNCRHEFISVPIDDVISMTDRELLKDNNMNVARATTNKYKASQEQRLYERKIRDYKFNLERNKDLLENSPNNARNDFINGQIAHDKEYLNKYRDKMRVLLHDNPHLERDYKRENVHLLREDLGSRRRKNTQVDLSPQKNKIALDELTNISRKKKGK